MKVLVVEDTPAKLRKIIEALGDAGVQRSQVETAVCGYSARQLLREASFDLLLLDVLIPFRQESDPSSQVCIDLINDLYADGDLKLPAYIVGLTAYDEGVIAASDAFNGRLWNVIKVEESDASWIQRVKNCVLHIGSAQSRSRLRTREAEVLIICALRSPELEAVRRLEWSWEAEAPFDDVSFISRGILRHIHGEARVVAAAAPRMGMVASSSLTSKLVAALSPEVCVMPGICAGMSGKVSLGDVIFADPVWDYQAGKRSIDGAGGARFEVAPHQIQSSAQLRALAEQLSEDKGAMRAIKDAWQSPPNNDLTLRIGPVASGSAVVADAEFAKTVSLQQRAALGLEMEFYGVSSACAMASSPRPLFAGIKGVCDLADEHKADDFQRYAAYTSAAVMEQLLFRYFSTKSL